MNDAAHQHHQIDYIEFNVTDMEAAKAFYGAAFDWKFTDYAPEYVGIQKPHTDQLEAGGLRLMDSVAPGGPLVILYSDDLESSFDKVKAAGGEITAKIFSFPGGRRFQFRDPSGNELAVWGYEK